MKRAHKILFAAGFLAVLVMAVPWLLLGENSLIAYHDQLDGEMIAYILQAKHLWEGDVLPEFLGGADKTALTMPAPVCVLLFLGGDYFAAIVLMQLIGSAVGYLGMYLLAKEVTEDPIASVITAVMYAYLPFLPVYGLAQYGLPMLLWCVLRLREESCGRRRLWGVLAYGVLYASASSPVLVGFAVLCALAVWIGSDMLPGRRSSVASRRSVGRMCLLWGVMLAAYVAWNLPLLAQMLGLRGDFTSHKSEYALAGEGFLGGWLKGLLYGGQHSGDYHQYFIWTVFPAALAVLVWAKGQGAGLCRVIGVSLGCNIILAGISALWNSGAGVSLRGSMGALGAFQMDRLLWLCPCLWYLMLACGIAAVLSLRRERRAAGGLGCLAMAAVLGFTGFQILRDSDFKSNLQKLRNPEYGAFSFGDYYAVGVLEQVGEFLEERGLLREEYRVVSLGIDPAAALYHGFYCLDGYSNNYSLDYKHRFREILAPELEKSDYLREYYDGWGNRCYLFSAECPAYYTIEKGGFSFQDLEIDTEALREMGGDYLFSAAVIANAEELGLKLLREEAFETPGSYYRIFLYEVTGSF